MCEDSSSWDDVKESPSRVDAKDYSSRVDVKDSPSRVDVEDSSSRDDVKDSPSRVEAYYVGMPMCGTMSSLRVTKRLRGS